MYNLEEMDPRYVVFGSVFLLANRLQTVMDSKTEGLTAKQWFVIMMLGMFDNPPTLKELARKCDTSHQNTKQIVLKLEIKGFVRIEKDEIDGRAMRIVATDKCKEWDEENKEYTTSFIETMFKQLTKDQIATTCSSLIKLYDSLGEMQNRNEL